MNFRLNLALYLNFFVVAVLLNSVGIVILHLVTDLGVDKTEASILEAFKDLTIAVSAFLVASFIPRLGYKHAMLAALATLGSACMIMPILNNFWAAKLMFAMTGFSFMLLKIVAYSLIGLYAKDDRGYTSQVGVLEGFFSFSILIGTSLFSLFMYLQEINVSGWLGAGWTNTYWLLAAMCATSFILVLTTDIDESSIKPSEDSSLLKDAHGMLSLLARPVVLIFIASAFIYVFFEQALFTWLPTLYNDVFKLSHSGAVFLAGLLPLSIASGRIVWGIVMRYTDWFKTLLFSLGIGIVLMLGVISLVTNHDIGTEYTLALTWRGNGLELPLAALLLPVTGFFIGTVYPTICASLLSSLEKSQHSPMTGWIIVFSALGGTIGSRVLAMVYETRSGTEAISFLIYPLIALLVLFILFAYLRKKAVEEKSSHVKLATT